MAYNFTKSAIGQVKHTYYLRPRKVCPAIYGVPGCGKNRIDKDQFAYFSGDLMPVAKYYGDDNVKTGFADKTGSLVVPLEYDSLGSLSDGLAWVRKIIVSVPFRG